MKITFFGGVEEVTGSKYLVEHENTKILIDCGLFQGKATYKRNWDKLTLDPKSIDAVVVTHAHIDHTGYIPLLVKNGFKGKIYCSQATFALSSILLVDSGFLQEMHAEKINEKKSNKASENAYEPLYTEHDAQNSLKFFEPIEYNSVIAIHSLKITLINSGHILGAAFVRVTDGNQTLTFSGDLGRPAQVIMKAPPFIKQTDYLVLESTYGDRLHAQGDPIEELGDVVAATLQRKGVLVMPTFAVGRAQTILYCLYQLQQKGIIPKVPIFLDSPMAIKVTNLFCQFKDEHKLAVSLCNAAFDIATFTRRVEESKKINAIQDSAIIIAGSGMAEGGRAIHHFKHYISDPNNTILFVGYQAEGTLGRALLDGAKQISLFGKSYEVHAHIKLLDLFSAHADYQEILDWLVHFEIPPKKVFLTHGEVESAQSLKEKIEERFGWNVVIPKYLDSFKLE